MTNMRQLKVGIVGTGFGGRVILPCLNFVPGIKVVALTGRDVDRTNNLARKFDIPYAFDLYDDMLKMSELDLVCIATPPYLHSEMVKSALSADKHVLCEKPMALNMREAWSLLQMSKRSDRLALIDHQLRFHHNIIKIKQIIERSELGNVYHAELTYNSSVWADPMLPSSWWSDIGMGGGELNAIGSHFIDLLRWWFGDADSVDCRLRTVIGERRTADGGDRRKITSDDHVSCRISFDGNIDVSMVLSSVSHGRPYLYLRITAENGTVILNGMDDLLLVKDGTERVISEVDSLISEPVVGANPWRRSLVRYAEHILGCIQDDEPVRGATFNDGYNVQVIMDAARRSSSEIRSVSISELNVHEGSALIDNRCSI